jgi:ATP-binding cassette subfamily F protein uup
MHDIVRASLFKKIIMALFSITDAQLAYGHVALLDRASFSLDENERVGLIG